MSIQHRKITESAAEMYLEKKKAIYRRTLGKLNFYPRGVLLSGAKKIKREKIEKSLCSNKLTLHIHSFWFYVSFKMFSLNL